MSGAIRSTHLVHVLQLSVLIRLSRVTFLPILPLIVIILALHLHLHLLTLAVLLVALLDQEARTQLLRSGGRGEVTCGERQEVVTVLGLVSFLALGV